MWMFGDHPLVIGESLANLMISGSPICIQAQPAVCLRLTGGGGKVDAWKESKSLLGRELINRGWPVAELDATTTEWLRAIGTNKLFSILKQQMSSEQRWNTLADAAKWAGLPIVPSDPIKLRAARTIQKAVRRNAQPKLDESDYKISPGFFVCEDLSELPVLQSMELKTGIYLGPWDEVQQWTSKQLPVVPDELAIITLFREDTSNLGDQASVVTFPALDRFGRRVLLKGLMWQLGEKCVKTALKDHTVAMPDTVVVACTIWRDECSPDQWEQTTRNLVKSALQLFEEAEPSKFVLQVWGRSYRDMKSKVEPAAAISAQFHMRLFESSIESFLRLSGKSCAYLTPKDEKHLSRSRWGLIWLPDKVETDIAANRASDHSGLARSRTKFALRVRADKLEAIAKEVKPDQTALTFPIVYLYKVQPIPVELAQSQVVEWAAQLGWRVKVLKRLGQNAYLLGAAQKLPHDNMCMNGSLILIKEVSTGKREQKPSAFVAGPKPSPKPRNEQQGVASSSDPDPWTAYRLKNGMPVSTPAPAAPQAAKPLDGPIQSKFAAMEQRLNVLETNFGKLSDDSQQIVKALELTNQRVAGVEQHVQNMQQQMSSAIEKAMAKGMREQEVRLDAQFANIMKALHGNQNKRGNALVDDDEDTQMETPPRRVP